MTTSMTKLPSIKQSFQVKYEYRLHFTEAVFDLTNLTLKSIYEEYASTPVKTVVIIDDGVVEHHPGLMDNIHQYVAGYPGQIDLKEIVVVEGGERAKASEAPLKRVLESINDNGICRHSFVLVIGGGAVIDMAGYASSIGHRGVKLIRIPTTVLSQNDAAVGVKNGINFFGKKNFLGSFSTPYAIINDFLFLETLDNRDWLAGIAEAVKVAAIKDEHFFIFLEEHAVAMANRKKDPMMHQIYRCAELHMQHIAEGGDPFESGSSRPLDFGHWSAHKLEQMTNFKLRHGEAVAMGIGLDVTYSYLSGLISEETQNRILGLLKKIGFDLRLPLHSAKEIERLLEGIEEFREHLGGQLTITLIKGIGIKYDVHEIDLGLMRKAIEMRRGAKALSL